MKRRDSPDRPIHVLVVDDSAVVRQAMSALLENAQDMSVTVAADPLIAMRKMERQRPDVILLDLEMPRMDGLTFLRKIMASDPIPVVVCSSYAARGTRNALRALEEGAVEVLAKPKLGVREFLHESATEMFDTIRAAAQAHLRPRALALLPRSEPRLTADAVLPPRTGAPRRISEEVVVAIGASTGGPEALRQLLEVLPGDAPAIVIVQHMPEPFTATFADRLHHRCRIQVREAAEGDRVVKGQALIAPGNRHMMVVDHGSGYRIELAEGPPVCRHRPSVDVLFRSVAQVAGCRAVGVIMTGMGADGATGLLEMKQAGAATIAQDEASCIVFGMPREAIARGAADTVVPLPDMPAAILNKAFPKR
ncbi:MAG: chemotaxis response regulator protein-glutamate methylesterase [bacterium]|nr:chemotaxis response regulator protein-glutamate methylesterase [bacterium]